MNGITLQQVIDSVTSVYERLGELQILGVKNIRDKNVLIANDAVIAEIIDKIKLIQTVGVYYGSYVDVAKLESETILLDTLSAEDGEEENLLKDEILSSPIQVQDNVFVLEFGDYYDGTITDVISTADMALISDEAYVGKYKTDLPDKDIPQLESCIVQLDELTAVLLQDYYDESVTEQYTFSDLHELSQVVSIGNYQENLPKHDKANLTSAVIEQHGLSDALQVVDAYDSSLVYKTDVGGAIQHTDILEATLTLA